MSEDLSDEREREREREREDLSDDTKTKEFSFTISQFYFSRVFATESFVMDLI